MMHVLTEYARQLVVHRPELNDTIMNELNFAQSQVATGVNETHVCADAKKEMNRLAGIY
jgi:hypothetical protein